MATRPTLRELTTGQFLGQLELSLAIYADAMQADPQALPGRRELMRRHAGYPDFRALQALVQPAGSQQPTDSQPASAASQVAGFAYGFRGRSGQWWFDAVWQALARAQGAGRAAIWLADSFEIAEVHVFQQYQRGGVGTAMLLSLTAGRAEQTAVLSTPDRDSTARRLYRRMGFTELLTGYSFPGGSPPYVVMGAELPLRAGAGELTRSPAASPSIS